MTNTMVIFIFAFGVIGYTAAVSSDDQVCPSTSNFEQAVNEVVNVQKNTDGCLRRENVLCKQEIAKLKTENDQLKIHLGWNCSSTSCYYVSDYQATWKTAAADCSSKGFHLAIITSAEENAKLVEIAEANKKDGTGGFWIDGTDIREEGTWIWNSTGQALTYTNFHDGEPNNSKDEDCLELYYKKNALKWNDAPCTTQNRQFICERDIN